MRTTISSDLAQARLDTDRALTDIASAPHDPEQLRQVSVVHRLLQIERGMADSELPQMIEQMALVLREQASAVSVSGTVREDMHTDIYLNIARCVLLMGNSMGALLDMTDALRQRDLYRHVDHDREKAEDDGSPQRAAAFADALIDIDRANWGEGPLFKGDDEWTLGAICLHAEKLLMRYGLPTESARRKKAEGST